MSHDDRSGNQDVSSMDLSVTINEPAQESPDSTNKANVIVQGLVPQQERLPSRDELDHLFRAEEDYDQPTTTRKELWSYYLYYNGELVEFLRFQWALTGAGWQPGTEPHEPCTASSACVVPWAGGTLSVSSVVLIANGLCFTFMTVIFVWLGSAADYGSFGRWLLLVLTVVCWALQYGMMAIKHPNQWPAAMGMYVVAYVAYGATLVFYAAVFPRLARFMPHVRKAREEDLREDKITLDEYDAIESLEKNHIRL
ncbi:unnamed protein product [Aspergillus oryzae]|uniref:Autophagy-related protein n=2 Tax=Aspergillus oryzae TaxID=5062 RepID=A0AAN4YMM9_ASPOZ|nr:unnamed protein product [Aspergillus oryzae]GMF85569.1 unnamed protein product [Aspergillus oryzae]GMG33921.1 unnamed protein product [Aspergillus oryzae]GMG55217.1 unnamed protein product [Aspergillus oryzae var. brunneus]